MSTPDVSLTIRDPGLGIVPANAGRTQVKMGACATGVVNVLAGYGSVNAAKAALGAGPLLDSVVQALDVGGGPVYAMPVLVTAQGTVTGGFTLAGSGTGTVTGSKAPAQAIKVKIILGGALTTMTFQVAVGSGAYGPTLTSAAAVAPTNPYQPPGDAFSSIAFTAGTYVTGDVYTINTDGSIVRTGTGTSTLLSTSTFSPVDAYNIQVVIMSSGALGAGTFKYSLDGGHTFSATLGIPASGVYTLLNTGVVLTFAGTFTVADVYTGTTTPPGYTTGDLNTALTALLADPTDWGWIHVVGQSSSAANAFTLAGIVDAAMTAAQSAFRYVFAIIECPQAEGDSAIKSAFSTFQSARVGVVVGDADIFSRLTGRTDRRSAAWAFTARLGSIALSKDPSAVNLGRLANVAGLYRDEAATPGLDDARFITLRTFVRRSGYYVNNFRLMSAPGSDFTYGMNRRVMDRLCQLSRDGYLNYLNDDVRVSKTTGFINAADAQVIDNTVTAIIKAGIGTDASSVKAQIGRADNILSTSTATAEVTCIPKGYLKQINVTIGFTNPVLQAAA